MAKGHLQAEDLTGQRFHHLTVIGRSQIRKFGKAYFDCLCDCGNTITTRASSLRLGRRRSCGCKTNWIWMQRTQDRELILKKQIYRRYVRGTWKRQYKNESKFKVFLSFDEFSKLILEPCSYCGEIGSNTERDHMDTSDYVLHYNGIDRIDSSKPYTIDNVVPCCLHCNKAKNSMTIDEFRNWAGRLYRKFVING